VDDSTAGTWNIGQSIKDVAATWLDYSKSKLDAAVRWTPTAAGGAYGVDAAGNYYLRGAPAGAPPAAGSSALLIVGAVILVVVVVLVSRAK